MTDIQAQAPAPPLSSGAGPRRLLRSARRTGLRLLGIVPFSVYVLLGLVLPTAAIAAGAFQDSVNGHFTLSNVHAATHGAQRNADSGTAYYAFDHGVVRCVVMDTVNPHGGWQGSLDSTQFGWLASELSACADRPVVLFSHHPLETLVNDTCPPGSERRVLGEELRDLLLAHPCVVAWINGHTHIHAVTPVLGSPAPGGFWQVTTASHIDWPQQARLIELVETSAGLALYCTMLDSAAPSRFTGSLAPADLAALGRELAANDWQLSFLINGEGGAGAGAAADRNVILPIEWPRRPPPASASRRPVG